MNEYCRIPAKVTDGTWTHNIRDHNPTLYQLSYSHSSGNGTWTRDLLVMSQASFQLLHPAIFILEEKFLRFLLMAFQPDLIEYVRFERRPNIPNVVCYHYTTYSKLQGTLCLLPNHLANFSVSGEKYRIRTDVRKIYFQIAVCAFILF